MPAFNKFNDFSEQLCRAKHDFGAHSFKLALTNTAPVAANTILADITQIATGGGYTAGAGGGLAVPNLTISETGGVTTIAADQVTLTATGAVGTFRYYVLYNDTATSPADALIGWWDHGSAVTLANSGDQFTVKFNNAATAGTILTAS